MMKRKLLIALIVLIGAAAAFAMIMLTTFAAIAAWIYLVWQVAKKKTTIFHDQMAPELVKKRYRLLKISLWVGAIAFLGGIAGVVAHNVLYGLTEMEEAVSFFIALGSLWLFILATGGGLFIYIMGQRKPA